MKLPACCSSLRYQCLLLLAGAAVFVAEAASAAPPPVPSPQRAAEITHLLRQDCGSCHGLMLQGGLGGPLTPAALADKPDDSLLLTVLKGRPGTAMPPWQPFLSEDEARWLIQQLKQGVAP